MRGETPVFVPTTGRSRPMAVLAIWMLILTLVAPGQAGASGADEADFVARVNATRASVGLAPLTVDSQLTSLARGWAGQMRDGVCGEGNNICHAGSLSSGVSRQWEKLGENVGTGPSVGDVMPAFIASPSHYANIVDPSYTHIGVGVVWDGGRLYTTHRFMAVAAPPPTTTTTTTAAPATAAPPNPSPEVNAAPATTAVTNTSPTAPTQAPATSTAPRTADSGSDTSSPNAATNQTDAPTSDRSTDTSIELPEVLPTPALRIERSDVVSASVLQLLSSTS